MKHSNTMVPLMLSAMIISISSSSAAQDAACQTPSWEDDQCFLYMAGGLFSFAQRDWMAKMTAAVEGAGFNAFLPQRDGFEFSQFNSVVREVFYPGILDFPNGPGLNPEQAANVQQAVQIVIWYLDMGFFVPRSHAITAWLDEPLDPGVIVEATVGRIMGKPVLVHKNDSLSNYGGFFEKLAGMHFFPAFQSTSFIVNYTQTGLEQKLIERANIELLAKAPGNNLVQYCSKTAPITPGWESNPVLSDGINGASILFNNITPGLTYNKINTPSKYRELICAIHTTKGIKKVVENYLKALNEDPGANPSGVFKAYPHISNQRLNLE